jgi:NADH-quinone oxidoreductase subunit J
VIALDLLAQAPGDAAGGGTAEFWVFWILAPISLGAAIAMVLMRNAVHAALMLVLNFFTVAALYAVLQAQFLAVVQIIVYAGAVMVLFLFVLMLLGVAREEPRGEGYRWQRPAALVGGLALFAALAVTVAGPYLGAASTCPPAEPPAAPGEPCVGLADANAEGNVRGVGLLLFTRYVWPFEATAVLLVIAAIGAVVLGRRREPPESLIDRPQRPSDQLPVPPEDAR